MNVVHALLALLLLSISISGLACAFSPDGETAAAGPAFAVQPRAPIRARPFPLSRVRLLDGPFRDAQERCTAYLLSLEPDRLLSGFRSEARLEPRAEPYGGWERETIAGHSLGHYLSACALAFAATGDERFRDRTDYIVAELAACQDAHGDGYVAAIPGGRQALAEVARGEIRSKGFDLNGIWVPWYTTHKLMAGLCDAHLLCGSKEAKGVLVELAGWAHTIVAKLDDAQIQEMLACEHGGMNEAAADTYALTGDERHLDLAQRFYHRAVLEPLSRSEDCLPGIHGNTQIPKLIGCARLYELTGEKHYLDAARFFWETVVDHHSYAIGGNTDHEYFGPPGRLAGRLSGQTAETCNTYNMLKLTKHLFGLDPRGSMMDFYERALFNHILASQDPKTGMVCYYVPLNQGARKTYSTPFDSFWCCVGTGMENHVRYGESIYFEGDGALYVCLYIASELSWPEKGMTLRQETDHPDGEGVRLALSCERPVDVALRLRCPGWLNGGMKVLVNDEPRVGKADADGFVTLAGPWHDGDVVALTLPMGPRTEAMPDDADRFAVLYGPIVMAVDLGEEPSGSLAPALVVEEGAGAAGCFRRTAGKPLTLRTDGAGRPEDFSLIPFFRTHHRHYSVYIDAVTGAEWEERRAEAEAEQAHLAALEARTVDVLRIGEMQPEREHKVDGEKTSAGEHLGRKWRHAVRGGWFAFDMKVPADKPADLVCTYWGSDAGGRRFDVLVDGTRIATQVLDNDRPGAFFDVTCPIPAELTHGRERVRVRFQAHEGMTAGGLFGCRTVVRE